jgi:type IV secretion system protein VirB9
MKKVKKRVLTAMILTFTAGEAFAAIPQPVPRAAPSEQQLREIQAQYPNLAIPDDAWVTPTGRGLEADLQKLRGLDPYREARYEGLDIEDENDEYGDYENPEDYREETNARNLRDVRRAQAWLDIEEDLTLRKIDEQALSIAKDFAAAKNVVPPMPGSDGVIINFGGYVPKVVCRPNRLTDIALQPGEKVTAVHAGDTTRWLINPAKSGSGAGETVHVVIKPLLPDISTNLLVMTDRRTYNLDLVSSPQNFVPSLRFNYPDDAIGGWGTFIAENRKDIVLADMDEGSGRLSPDDLYFGYTIAGKADWKPLRVFDDGVKTYIEMPAKYKSLEAPVLMFYEGRQMKMVNYRVKDRFYVVDRIMTKKAVFIAGKARVVIERQKEGKQ